MNHKDPHLLINRLNLQRSKLHIQRQKLKHQIELLKNQRRIDRAFRRLTFFAGGVAMPLLTIPQLYTIWATRQTAGVSFATWLCYALISLIFFMFGLRNRQKLLMVTYLPMFVIEVFIVIGLVVY